MDSLIKFYDDNYINELLDIININNNISLRRIGLLLSIQNMTYIKSETSYFIVLQGL